MSRTLDTSPNDENLLYERAGKISHIVVVGFSIHILWEVDVS